MARCDKLAGVMTGKGILDGMQERDKDREKAARRLLVLKGIARTEEAKKSTSGLIIPVRLHPRVRFQFTGTPTRILNSATCSILRLNHPLPPLTELHTDSEDESNLEYLISPTSSSCQNGPRTSKARVQDIREPC